MCGNHVLGLWLYCVQHVSGVLYMLMADKYTIQTRCVGASQAIT